MILKFKNMLSFGGDKEYEVNLDIPRVNQFYGENGLGKSNILRLIKIGCYFDYPAKVNMLVNDDKEEGFLIIEHDGYIIEQTFTKKGLKDISVKKGLKDVDTGNLSNTKVWISNNVFTINKDVFYNVYIPSIDKFKSFIGMSPSDSKKIRDELFSLTTLNDKLVNVVKKNNSLLKEIDIDTALMTRQSEEIETLISEIKDLKDANLKDVEEKKKLLDSKKLELDSKKLELDSSIKLLESKLNFLANKEFESEIKSFNEEIKTKSERLDVVKKLIASEELIEKNVEKNISINKLIGVESKLEICSKDISVLDDEIEELNKKLKDISEHEAWEDKIKLENKKAELISKRDVEQKRYDKRKEQREKDVEEHANLKAEILSLEKQESVYGIGDVCDKCLQTIEIDEKEKEKVLSQLSEKKKRMDVLKSSNKENKEEMSKLEDILSKIKSDISDAIKEEANYTEVVKPTSIVEDRDEVEVKVKNKEKSLNELTTSRTELNGQKKTLLEVVGDDRELSTDCESINNKNKLSEEKDTLVGEIGSLEQKIVNCTNKKHLEENTKPTDESKEVLEEELENEKIKLQKNSESLTETNLQIQEIKNGDKNEVIQREEARLEAKQKESKIAKEKLESDKLKYEDGICVEYVLSDDGIKKWHLDKIRNSFSRAINMDLKDFGLSIRFNADFSITIYKNGKELDQGLMSVGQKKIIDTMICIHFILLYNKKYPTIKFIVMDESMSNLSKNNSQKIIRKVIDKLVTKGFSYSFIHHAPVDASLCDKQYKMVSVTSHTEMVEK